MRVQTTLGSLILSAGLCAARVRTPGQMVITKTHSSFRLVLLTLNQRQQHRHGPAKQRLQHLQDPQLPRS